MNKRLKKLSKGLILSSVLLFKTLFYAIYLIFFGVASWNLFRETNLPSAQAVLFQNADGTLNWVIALVWTVLSLWLWELHINSFYKAFGIFKILVHQKLGLEHRKDLLQQGWYKKLIQHFVSTAITLSTLAIPIFAMVSLHFAYYVFALILMTPMIITCLALAGFVVFQIFGWLFIGFRNRLA